MMNSKGVEATLRVLEGIAGQYAKNTTEEKAIRAAGEALFFVYSDEMRTKFVKYMLEMKGGLTPAQKLHLRAIGVDIRGRRGKRRLTPRKGGVGE